MKICIIGFGCAGLAAARQISNDPNHECIVFEQSDRLGGTWVYTDDVGTGPYGLPVHTSMYKGLRTNLPKEIMGYPDFPIPKNEASYITSEDFLTFLNTYADHFQLKQYVKFEHQVKNVEPVADNKWEVSVLELPNNREYLYTFDAVVICNGHYHTPWYPNIKGMDSFEGESLHSHDYRDSKRFEGKRVAIIGAGPSGIDMALEIAKSASKVILSQHRGGQILNVLPKNAEMKHEIVEIQEKKVCFDDETSVEVDTILYCTGYKYNFPFLSDKCGVTVEDNCVQPLFKHLIHIEYQTMALIGLPYYVCACSLFDLQVRFFLKFLNGQIQLPSKTEMYADTEEEMKERRNKGLKKKQFHMMGTMQGDYYTELAVAGGLEPLPQVMAQLHNHASKTQMDDLTSFRNKVYKIIDTEKFVEVK